MNSNDPYLIVTKTETIRKFNPNYGNKRMCVCGHPYYRHFDTYEDMDPVGCKYCGCQTFEDIEPIKIALERIKIMFLLNAEKSNMADELKLLIKFVEDRLTRDENES